MKKPRNKNGRSNAHQDSDISDVDFSKSPYGCIAPVAKAPRRMGTQSTLVSDAGLTSERLSLSPLSSRCTSMEFVNSSAELVNSTEDHELPFENVMYIFCVNRCRWVRRKSLI